MKKQSITANPLFIKRYKLYHTLVFIYKMNSLKDLLLLQSKDFFELCGVSYLDFHFTSGILNQAYSKSEKKTLYPFQFSQVLHFKDVCYGEVNFYSHKKFLKDKQAFLKQVALSLSASFYFIVNNQKASSLKTQWAEIFHSFSQAFCVTNETCQIIHCNQAFEKLFCKKKKDLVSQSLFQLFPFPVKTPPFFFEKPSSFIAQAEKEGQKIYWEIACKKLYLQKEQTQILLFLIKDVSQEMKISAKISAQSKEQEVGWMKGSLAHELNNPIAGIKILLNVLEKELSDSDTDTLKDLTAMQKSIDECHKVIQNLLSVSKQRHKS